MRPISRSTDSWRSRTRRWSAGSRSRRYPTGASTGASSRAASTLPPAPAAKGSGNCCSSRLIESTEAAGIWTIQGGMFPDNTASIKLHESVGFELVGRRKRLGKLNGEWRDVLLMERRSEVVL